jgi:hypothetical protein
MGKTQERILEIFDAPKSTFQIVVSFGLTDINLRREYDWIQLSQCKSEQSIDLTDHFTVYDNQLPKLGKTVDVIMPWDPKLP